MSNQQTRPIVFVDMDGVLVDFWSAAVRLCGFDPATVSDDKKRLYTLGWLTEGKSLTVWDLIEKIGSSFWTGLEPYPWAESLWSDLHGSYCATVLTSPTFDPSSSAGKHAWIKRHFGTMSFLIGPDKKACAGPGRVLVDDCPTNLQGWKEAGGIAIPFKQPWCPDGFLAEEIVGQIETEWRDHELR